MIEDDGKIATAVKRGLEAEGFTVEVAFDGDDGLWLATEGQLRPDRARHHAARAATASRSAPICERRGDWTPILMLTAKDGDLDEAEALDTGADDYLTKPFSFPVLHRPRALAAAARSAGERRPCRSQRRRPAHRPGRRAGCGAADAEVALTAREFDVLEFLVRRAGQVVSKREILDGVWEYDFDGDPNIVEVYIRRLRASDRRALRAPRHRDGARRRLPAGQRRGLMAMWRTIRFRITVAGDVGVGAAAARRRAVVAVWLLRGPADRQPRRGAPPARRRDRGRCSRRRPPSDLPTRRGRAGPGGRRRRRR